MINLYVANLGKYNEGYLVGDWISLPIDMDDEFKGFLEKIEIDGVQYEEYAIHDFETDIEGLEIGEYSSISELNELAELLEGLGDHDIKKIGGMLEMGFYRDLKDCIDNLDNYTLYEDINSHEELGYYWLFESGCYDVPDNLQYYIDCEKFGRDLELSSDSSFTTNGYIERC